MNYMNYLDQVATDLLTIIVDQQDSQPIFTKNYGWENYRYVSPKFHHAHLQVFKQPNFMVLHCSVFPNVTDPSPIFGFDVICSEKKVTGVFLDLSPTTVKQQKSFHNLTMDMNRDRPEWGDIFSEHWIAARPNEEEMMTICDEAKNVLGKYLNNLGTEIGNKEEIIAAQNYYCEQQSKNQHTYKMIKNLIGEELATEFVETVLFPKL